ncbi:Protein ELYS [Chelonia mydas]|uniref:Protein ELYS n=1 Tax=Chelonia mydas TaxID=8469 RepID=M7BZH3_CHEMY|nr:Protein ELYS [Chelonia mydas]
MRDLTAQVTSSLLQFPEVTVQALGEDEITLESVLRGKFAGGRNGLAYLACGPQLEVVNSITGERLSAYRFNGVNEHPPTVLVVKEFSWQKRTGLLVGLEEAEGSVLCLYDLGVSRVVKAVVLPGRVTAIEPIINHGGARVSTQHLHQSLRWLFGVAGAGYTFYQLLSPSGAAVTTLCYISRSNQLVVGFSDGYLSLWNMKTLKKEYHFQLEGGRIPVYAVTFQEPENDPRNCCYLWAVQSTQESEGDVVSLHLLQLAFGDRKRLASGQIMYEGLEYCEERYSLDLTGGVFSLRGQTSNTKLLSCQTIEKFRSHIDREDGVNEVISPDTSVSVFSWQVNTYGQGKPSTYLGIFDINRWYHAQMPDSLRLANGDSSCCQQAPSVLSPVVSPQLCGDKTLHFLKKSGSSLNEAIPDNFNRCLIAGLLSPRLIDVQPSSLSQEEQLEAILSAAVQTSSLGLLTGCIKQWTAEEQPNSAANLRFVLEWTWNKVIYTKDEFDRMYFIKLLELRTSSLLHVDDDMQLSRPFYNYPLIQSYCTGHRQKLERLSRGKWNADCLMIDGLLSQLGDQVEKLWRRDEGGTGKYPPASLHALLDLYLLQNIEETYKHAISSLALLFHPATIKTMSWQHMKIIQALMCQGEHRQALRYIQMMKPSMSSSSEVALHLTVLLFNRCMVEAWSLLRQHSTRLNVEELLKHMYEVCQEMGLMEDLLKLPFTDTEQECLEKFLQTSAGIQNHEFLLVHHLQRANYIPALQLNQSLKVNLMNDRDPRLRERSVARNSILDQYGKILPRVQRKLAVERAKPYHLSSSILREVSRPKPLSTVAKQTTAGNVLTRATFINNVLSKIGEVWVGNEQKSDFSQYDSPRIEEPPPMALPFPDTELPDPFVGTPVTKSSRKSSSPLQSNSRSPILHTNISRASELNLLETPLVVKRAKALATSSAASGFPGFTLQSILRSSLRTTPIATPSASSGRSITPPLRAKEPRISFREENATSKWTAGMLGDDKTKPLVASSEHNLGVQMEDTWSKDRDKVSPFTLICPEEDPAEMNESSKGIAGDVLEKMEVSKETSNFSARSDQTTLEYHDARSPGDFEDDVIFITSKPANSSDEGVAIIQEEMEAEGSEVVKSEPLQLEQQTSSELEKQTGFLERTEIACPTLPEEDMLVLNRLSIFQVAGVSTCLSAGERVSINTILSIYAAVKMSPTCAAFYVRQLEVRNLLGKKSLSAVISILHSEDIPSTHSENQLQEERVEDLHEDQKSEEAAIEENVLFLQEKTSTSKSPPETKEVNIIEDGTSDVQASEETAETPPFNEQYPSGTLKLQYNFDAIKQQFTCDLPDTKDTDECDAAEGDGELFMSESNFTLILEGEEGETETGDPTLDMSTKPVSTKTEDKHMNHVGNIDNQENITNSVPTVTSDQESQNIAEPFPYVPEPVKVAIAENLLDVIKDTRSKEFISEVVEQSVHESIPLMSKMVTSSQKSIKTPLTTGQEANADNASVCQVDYVVTPKRPRGRKRKNLNIPSTDAQQLSNAGRPDLLGPCTLRRSARRTKETSAIHEGSHLDSDGNSQDQQISQIPDTPRRGSRKTRGNHLETSDNVHSIGQSLQMVGTPRRRLRRTREPASVLSEQANEEIPLAEEAIKLSATSKRTGRGAKHSIGDQENSQLFTDHKVKMAVSPSKSGRKLKSVSLQLTENIITDQETEPYEQQLPVPTRRGRRKKTSTSSEVSENCELDTSKPSHHQMELKSSVTTRRNIRRRTLNLPAGTDSIPTLEDVHSEEREKMPDTPKRRATRVTPAKVEKTGTGKPTLEKTPVQPVEALAATRTSARAGHRNRKRQLQSVSEESTEEEGLPQGTDCNPSLLVADLTESRLDEMERTLAVHGTRVTRTRSSKIGMHQKLSLEENESFFFSPPLTKLTKKSKAEKAEHPVQLKDLDPELSSQFVFSPPLLRSRRKHVSSISRIVKELELPIKDEDNKTVEFVGKQKVKRRRATKSKTQKASKTTGKECSWSPPPVEIKFISPFGSPVDGTKSKQKETAETAEKTLRKNKKRLSNFPKPVREKDACSRCVISMNSSSTSIYDPKNPGHMKTFTFDLAYWSHSGFLKDKDGMLVSSGSNSRYAGQREVFRDLGQGVLDNAWQGYNATLLAYGQTGSGKSYSMIGYGANRGIIPVVCEELFKPIQNQKNKQYQVTFSMLEIYNEQVIDLLSEAKKPGGLKVREDQQQGFYVDGLKLVPCDSYAQIERLMEQGTKIRTTASTSMNATSSRSHMVITIQFKQIFLDEDITKQSIINLVDLAGSERQKSSGSEGDRLREGTRVNLSLTTLGNVISALAEVAMGKKVLHIPYRDSVLTKLLQSALGGNSRTIMIAAVSPADICYEETLSTLRYAERTKKIKNKAVINASPMEKHIMDLKAENNKLLSRLTGLGNSGKTVADETKELQCLLAENELRIQTIQLTWEYRLEEARKEWEQQYAAITQDRVILGSNSAYLYVGFPAERTNEDLVRYDYDFFQSELAAAEGFSVDKLGVVNHKDGKPDPSVLAVFHDYIKLMPLVAEANQMSEELKKELKLELKVKNLASSDSRGYDLQKEVIVKVTNKMTNQVWVWSKAKFINRKFLMEEVYQHFLDGEDVYVGQDSDPFWDPVEVIHLGSAHIWLQSLAYCMKLEEQTEVLNSEGMEEAILLINIVPCSSDGRAFGEDDMIIDPLELLGRRIDFQINILQCLGVKWLREVTERGIQIGYRVYDLLHSLHTKPVWKNMNAKIEETVHFSALSASHEFLNYLQKNALIVDLWGLQEGCAELDYSLQDMVTSEGTIIVDNPKTVIAKDIGLGTANQISELYLKLLKLEEETELLRDINRALTEENASLKDKLKKWETGHHESKKLKSPNKRAIKMTKQPLSSKEADQMCNHRTSYDAEFAKALKVFYQNMNLVRGQFLKLKHSKPPEEDNLQVLRLFTERQSHMLKDFGEQLESSICRLKNDVALIVKKKRESIA